MKFKCKNLIGLKNLIDLIEKERVEDRDVSVMYYTPNDGDHEYLHLDITDVEVDWRGLVIKVEKSKH